MDSEDAVPAKNHVCFQLFFVFPELKAFERSQRENGGRSPSSSGDFLRLHDVVSEQSPKSTIPISLIT